jgi:hypothetical protein
VTTSQTCAKHGITREAMINEAEGELTVAYTRYVLDLATSKSLLHLRVATAPCLFGYGEIANRLLAEGSGLVREGNPYLYWIEECVARPLPRLRPDASCAGTEVLHSRRCAVVLPPWLFSRWIGAQAVRIGRDLLEDIVKTESISPKLLQELSTIYATVRPGPRHVGVRRH